MKIPLIAPLALVISMTAVAGVHDPALLDFLSTDWKRIDRLEDLPRCVAHQIGPMANPGQPFNSGCVIQRGLPGKELVFAGSAPGRCFVYYIQGAGIVAFVHLDIYTIDGETARLSSSWDIGEEFGDIGKLKLAVHDHPPRRAEDSRGSSHRR